MRITYYAVAQNEKGKIEQLLVARENGRQVSQTWTGVIYASMREANWDLERLNCEEPGRSFWTYRELMATNR